MEKKISKSKKSAFNLGVVPKEHQKDIKSVLDATFTGEEIMIASAFLVMEFGRETMSLIVSALLCKLMSRQEQSKKTANRDLKNK
jgi:hypothetical protein